ncbi:MAG: SpoIVB peptidase S55 domain-containing protein [Clostridia bacterium]|nr:SpoIVB peptidase S55 domain-containing protein [Clostridia bacterium]
MFRRISSGRFLAFAVIACIVVLWAHSPAMAASSGVPTMGVHELTPGMAASGRTVFAGTAPEDFPVEILGVLPGAGQVGDLVLIRAFGPAIDKAGGIAEGMSGSPVYVDGKLIGAIAFVFPSGDQSVGMVTPIADMMRMLSYPDNADRSASVWTGAPLGLVASTVMVSGLSGRAYDRLADSLKKLGIAARQGAAYTAAAGVSGNGSFASGLSQVEPIIPGSAIGVQLAQGDIEITSFGTVTYVEGDRFLAFGHPLRGVGVTDLPACSAYVHGVFKSNASPFKVMSSGRQVGAFSQDRLTGMLGRTGANAAMTPVRVRVVDGETGREKETIARITTDDLIIADVFGSAVLAATDRTLERVGKGAATVTLKVDLDGREPFERINTFCSNSDVAGASASEAVDIVNLIASNTIERAKISGIDLVVQVDPVRRTAAIEKVKVAQNQVKPGDTIDVEVTLREYRGERIVKTVQLAIPEDVPGGPISICVRGGSPAYDEEDYSCLPPTIEELLKMDLDTMLEKLGARYRGNELVVELEPYYTDEAGTPGKEAPAHDASGEPQPHRGNPLDSAKGMDKQQDKAAKPTIAPPEEELSPEPVVSKVATDWVIEGIRWATVEIETPVDDVPIADETASDW